MNNSGTRYVGIYYCPVCETTNRFYKHKRGGSVKRCIAWCEVCRIVKVIFSDDKQYNTTGLIKDVL